MTKKLIILTSVLLQAVVFSTALFAEDENESTDVASVNGIIIEASEVRRELNSMYNRAVQQGVYPNESEIEAYWNYAVDNLINREILYQDALSNGYTPDAAAIDQYMLYLAQNSGGEAEMLARLSEQGLDVETVRESTGEYYVISEYVTEVFTPEVIIEDSEIRKYYDEHKSDFVQEESVTARHILLLVEEGSEKAVIDEALERITAVRDRILAGEDFGAVAAEVSEGPSAERGGELGAFGRGRMVKPFDEVAFSLEPGILSEPVLTQFGWHLIEVTAKTDESTIAFEEIEPNIREYLVNLALDEKVNLHVEGLKESFEIIIF